MTQRQIYAQIRSISAFNLLPTRFQAVGWCVYVCYVCVWSVYVCCVCVWSVYVCYMCVCVVCMSVWYMCGMMCAFVRVWYVCTWFVYVWSGVCVCIPFCLEWAMDDHLDSPLIYASFPPSSCYISGVCLHTRHH